MKSHYNSSNSREALRKVFKEFNETGKFNYTSQDLQMLGCYYSTSVKPFLKDNGYIDSNNCLLKPVELKKDKTINDMVIHYVNKYRDKTTLRDFRKDLKKEQASLFNDISCTSLVKKPSLQGYIDKDLVNELRARGYEVKAIKTIEL